MNIAFFFRKPTASFYSIETLFGTIINSLQRSSAKKVYLPYPTATGPVAILKNCLFARARQAQVNHITGEVYYIALAMSRKKTVLTIHDIDSLKRSNRIKSLFIHLFWLYLPVRRAKFVTVVSEYSKERLLAATGIAAEKVVVIPNCVSFSEEDFRPKAHLNKAAPVLLQVGTKKNKNLPKVIEAIKGLPCKLLILGKLTEEHLQLLESDGVSFENYFGLDHAAVVDLYYRADILLFVSTFEGFGMPILEANALGRAVITSNITSMPEVAGEAAVLVDPYRASEIRAAVERLVVDDSYRNGLVAAGLKNVQRFRPEAVAAKYEALYTSVLERDK